MMRLDEPKFSFKEAIDETIKGITGNNELKQRALNSEQAIISVEIDYIANAKIDSLHIIKPIIPTKIKDEKIVSDLTKSDFTNLYDNYFVDEKKPARKIYNTLLNSAKDECPFCGGIGKPRNLDHFLPKKFFPQYSILPFNLIPSCRDCNMDGKATVYAKKAEEQIIHPYLSDEKFFNQQWIFAKYNTAKNNNEEGEFNYFTQPPQEWSDIEKLIAKNHFTAFNLEKIYSTEAAALLGTCLKQINNLKKLNLDNSIIKHTLFSPDVTSDLFKNHWRKIMYQALADTLL